MQKWQNCQNMFTDFAEPKFANFRPLRKMLRRGCSGDCRCNWLPWFVIVGSHNCQGIASPQDFNSNPHVTGVMLYFAFLNFCTFVFLVFILIKWARTIAKELPRHRISTAISSRRILTQNNSLPSSSLGSLILGSWPWLFMNTLIQNWTALKQFLKYTAGRHST